MTKDTYWFRHDSNARNDVKLVKLRRVAGLEGVGLFWCAIEMLRESKNYELPLTAIADIAFDLRVDEKVFDVLFECGLLVKGDSFFYSDSLLHRMNEYDKVKEKRRQAGSKGGKAKASAKIIVASAKQNSSKATASVKQSLASRVELNGVEESRLDKKVIDTKKIKHKHGMYENVLFTDDEFEKLKTEFPNDYIQRIEKVSEYVASTGKSYKSHLATIRSWARKENGGSSATSTFTPNFKKPNSRDAKRAGQCVEPEINLEELMV